MRVIFIGLFLFCINATLFSQNERFKSLFVYNFTKNIEWPSNYQDGDFVITVLGNSTMYSELLQNVSGKICGNQKIQVTQAANISGVEKCNILYVPSQQSALLDAAGKHLAGKPTVVITEKNGLMKLGADINIVHAGGKLQFEVNPQQIDNKKLKINNILLKLGIVYDINSSQKTLELESVDDASMPR
jgi:hypothetical protein